jgi:OOP family OmpA-OmpF porin
MFKQPKRKILVGIVSGALFSAASSVAVLAADDEETHILISGSGGPVLSGRQGECVKTPVTPNDPNKPFEECGYAKDEDPCAKDSDGDGVDDCKDKCPNSTAADIAAGIDERGCVVNQPIAVRNVLGADVLFDFDKATLKEAGKQELNRIASEILQYSNRAFEVIVVGHADSVGSREYNQKLSERRAKSVVDYLVTQGVAANLFNPPNGRGEGEDTPIADNKTKEGRAQNRRVVIDIKSTDTPSQ